MLRLSRKTDSVTHGNRNVKCVLKLLEVLVLLLILNVIRSKARSPQALFVRLDERSKTYVRLIENVLYGRRRCRGRDKRATREPLA